MAKFSLLVICSTLVLLAELCCSRAGIHYAGSFFICFYFTVAFNWRVGLAAGCCVCIVSEILFGCRTTALPMMALITCFAHFWRRNGDRRFVAPQALPGLALGLAYAGYYSISENLSLWPWQLRLSLADIAIASGLGALAAALAFPLTVLLFDLMAGAAGMRKFCNQSWLPSRAVDDDDR